MLRAPIWIMSAYSSTSSSDSLSSASVTIRRPNCSRTSAMMLQAFLAHALEGIRRGARLVRAAAEELRPGCATASAAAKACSAAFDRAGAGDDRQISPADRRIRAGKADDRVLFLHIAADQLVGLGDLDDFRHARHLCQRILLHRALVSRDADGGPLRARHGVGPVTQRFDLLANGLDFLRPSPAAS